MLKKNDCAGKPVTARIGMHLIGEYNTVCK